MFIISRYFSSFFYTREAQTFAIRLSARHKPLSNMGSLRPDGAVPILKVLLVSSRVAIESLLSNMSLPSFRIAGAKLSKNLQLWCLKLLKSHKMWCFYALFRSWLLIMRDFLLLLHSEFDFLELSQTVYRYDIKISQRQSTHDKTMAASSYPQGRECWRYSAVSCEGVESLMS